MAIRALIFDFDGLILETEGPAFQAWQTLYRAYGQELPLDRWLNIIGTHENYFDPHQDLEERVGHPLDWAVLDAQRRAQEISLVEAQAPMPGVSEYLATAKDLDIKLGVASSSSYNWVGGHLSRLGLLDCFDTIQTRDQVERTKPDPALYLAAAAALQVPPGQAVAFEDSLNGVISAKRAGLWCVAVPNQLTRSLPLEAADLRLDSLADLPLPVLLTRLG